MLFQQLRVSSRRSSSSRTTSLPFMRITLQAGQSTSEYIRLAPPSTFVSRVSTSIKTLIDSFARADTLPEASSSLLLPRSPSELSYLSEPDVGDISAALVHSGDGSEESTPQAFPAWRSLPTSPAISPMTSFDSISQLSDVSDDTYEMSSTEVRPNSLSFWRTLGSRVVSNPNWSTIACGRTGTQAIKSKARTRIYAAPSSLLQPAGPPSVTARTIHSYHASSYALWNPSRAPASTRAAPWSPAAA